jgi:hypothetical protein
MKYDANEPDQCKFCYVISTGAALIGSALIGGAASLIGGSQAAGAAEDASDAQVRAAQIAADLGREGLAFQQEMFDTSRADLAPWRASGTAALGVMNDLFIPGGQGVVQMQSRLNELRARRAVLARTGGAGGAGAAAPTTPVQQAAGGPPFNTPDEYRQWYSGGDQGILNRLDPGR